MKFFGVGGRIGAVILATSCLAGGQLAAQVFPLEENVAVVTMAATSNVNGFAVGTYDIRDPDCNGIAPPTCINPSQNPSCITNWPAAQYHNEMPNPTNNPLDVWTEVNLGAVFGLELDDEAAPNIYVTSTTVYFGSPVGTGRVMKINGTTGAISLFVTLPNSGQGLGNITYDRRTRQFYVTNHEDGKIYRLGFGGAILNSFDPFAADDGLPGYCPLGERLWGIEVSPVDGRLYFGRWNEDSGRPGADNEVWSVNLAGDGNFVGGSVTLEITVPASAPCVTQPVSDIAFSAGGNILLGTRSMNADAGFGAHTSTDWQYAGGHLAWVLTTQFDLGLYTSGCGRVNSAGGVDYTDCAEDDDCNPGALVVFTSDAIDLNPYNVYGLQISPAIGGNLMNSYFVDLDNDTGSQDKGQLGDVDVVRFCSQPPVGTGACCLDAQSMCVDAMTEADCDAQAGRYGGDGSTCGLTVFNPPCGQSLERACCLPDGSCVVFPTITLCLAQLGTPQPGNSCVGVVCEGSGIPTVSQWGLVMLALALLAAAKVRYGRRTNLA